MLAFASKPTSICSSEVLHCSCSLVRSTAQLHKLTVPWKTGSIETEMDGEKLAAASAARWKWSEEERLARSILTYWLFLCAGSSLALMAPSMAAKLIRPGTAVKPSLPAGFDLPVTCLVFAAATLLLQRTFARVLERSPAQAPRLTLNPLVVWPLAVCTWLFATACFVSYLSFGSPDDDEYLLLPRGSWAEWAATGVASAANLAMATRTVRGYFRSSRAFGNAADPFAPLA